MATAAGLYRDVFIEQQLPATFLDDLRAAVAAVQTAIAARDDARLRHGAATQSVQDQIVWARSVVRILDSLVVKQLRDRTDLLSAWKTAKQVYAKPGVARGTKHAAAEEGAAQSAA